MASVSEFMNPEPTTVSPDATVEEVARLLGQRDLAALPVVNEAGRCIGIVTESDLVLTDEEGDLHIPHYVELFGGLIFLEPLRKFEARLKKAVGSTAADLMTRDPVTIPPEADVHEAGRLVSESGHNQLPVVEHGRLVGLITRADVLRALYV